jgi:hypothetical protein
MPVDRSAYPKNWKKISADLIILPPRKNRGLRPRVTVDGKQVRISRFVMEIHLGRKLKSSEIVHHINENPSDNRIENLKVVNRAEHKKLHPTIGMATRLKKIYSFDRKEITDLRNRGFSFGRIGRLKGCNEATVRRFVRKIEREEI